MPCEWISDIFHGWMIVCVCVCVGGGLGGGMALTSSSDVPIVFLSPKPRTSFSVVFLQ
jgi:hypothetical protein